MSLDNQLRLLFARLAWPSGLARERACAAIAGLLLDVQQSETTRQYLTYYLKYQALESLSALGLLSFLYAQERDSNITVKYARELVSAVTKNSILSWLLVREIDETLAGKLEDSLVYSRSGTVPQYT